MSDKVTEIKELIEKGEFLRGKLKELKYQEKGSIRKYSRETGIQFSTLSDFLFGRRISSHETINRVEDYLGERLGKYFKAEYAALLLRLISHRDNEGDKLTKDDKLTTLRKE